MLSKIVLFIMGILLCSISLTFITLYLNILVLGYSFLEFVKFIIIKWECYLFIPGIIFIILSFKKRKM